MAGQLGIMGHGRGAGAAVAPLARAFSQPSVPSRCVCHRVARSCLRARRDRRGRHGGTRSAVETTASEAESPTSVSAGDEAATTSTTSSMPPLLRVTLEQVVGGSLLDPQRSEDGSIEPPAEASHVNAVDARSLVFGGQGRRRSAGKEAPYNGAPVRNPGMGQQTSCAGSEPRSQSIGRWLK